MGCAVALTPADKRKWLHHKGAAKFMVWIGLQVSVVCYCEVRVSACPVHVSIGIYDTCKKISRWIRFSFARL